MQFYKVKNILLITIISVISLLLSMHLSLFIDESFTMSLIHHSYHSIIDLDALDIHPPLYYLITKLLLQIFTLGHSNLTADVILSRLFSFGYLLLSFIVSLSTLHTMKLSGHAWQLYALLTAFLIWNQEAASIRMYPMAILFIVLEFSNLVKFIYYQRTRYLVLATIFAVMAAYTHDYAALIAGLFILIAFIHEWIKKSNDVYKWLWSGIVLFIAYLPWLKISFDQILNLPIHYWIPMINSLQDSLIFVTLLLFSYPVIKSFGRIDPKNQFIYQIVLDVCIIILIIELSLTIHQPSFVLRYVSPLLYVYITITFGLLSSQFKPNQVKSSHSLIIALLFGLIFITIGIYTNVQSQKDFHDQSIQLIQTFHTHKHRISINLNQATQGDIRHLCQFNTVAQYQHKSLAAKENAILFNNPKLKQGTNPKLIRKIWRTHTYQC